MDMRAHRQSIGWTVGWTDRLRQTDARMHGCTDAQVHGEMDGQTVRRIETRTDGSIDGGMDGQGTE